MTPHEWNLIEQAVRSFLLENPMARLFLIVSLGYGLGEVNWFRRFRLGVAAVLFVGLAFGMWESRFEFPALVSSIGLALFVYCVGLESGPGFFQSFRKSGLRAILALVVGLAAATGVCWFFSNLLKVDPMIWPGIFCGSLTNTPALASATETLRSLGDGDKVNLLVQGFGISYPIAIITLLIFLQWIMIWRKEKSSAGKSPNYIYPAQTLQILNPPQGDLNWTPEILEREFSVKVTRYQHPNGKLVLVTEDSMPMSLGSSFIAVGTPENIARLADAVGRVGEIDLVEEMHGFEVHRYHVSNPDVAEKPIHSLHMEKWGAIITRLRRGDIDLELTPDTMLQLGDRVRVISLKETEPSVRKLFGNSMIVLSESGYASFAFGIVMGVLVGLIPFFIPGVSLSFKLGSAGGCLLMGLLLGSQGRSGKIVWLIPQANNLALRQLGILFFLACVGVQAGGGFLQVLKNQGLSLVLPVMAITLSAHLTLCFVLRRFGFRDPEMWVGSCCGLQTQPAALAFASQKMDRAPLALAYATLFPMALLLKVILVQILVRHALSR